MTTTTLRWPTNWPVMLLRIGLVVGMLAAVPAALLLLVGTRALLTPTLVAGFLWMAWGVPLSALLVGHGERAAAKLLAALAGGWVITLTLSCAAMCVFPCDSAHRPHEILAFSNMVLAAGIQIAGCSFLAHSAPRAWYRWSVPVAVASVAALSGYIAWTNFATPIATELPLDARAIRQQSYYSMMGEHSWCVTASMSEPGFRAYVDALGLSRRAAPGDATLSWRTSLPEWFVPTGTTEVWYDPRREALSDSQSWTWTYVAWNGRTVWASHGAAWM